MNCKYCNKTITEYVKLETLQDGQCFACGSILNQSEIDANYEEYKEEIIATQGERMQTLENQ